MTGIVGVIFDKDGTLYDFEATWGAWTIGLIEDLAGGQTDLAVRLAQALRFDLDRGRFDASSPVIAGTADEAVDLLAPLLPDWSRAGLLTHMSRAADAAPLVEAVPLAPFLAGLRGRGLRLGVATNDSEGTARAHLQASGVWTAFDMVAGYDSGFGAKPAPGMLLGVAAGMGVDAGQVVMVGDSTHDLIAGRAAGMRTLAVLTGPATGPTLAPFAEAVLPDIGHLPEWLDAAGA
ncbi:MAG: HAD family hydrolase [Alkalilacustris sp.]